MPIAASWLLTVSMVWRSSRTAGASSHSFGHMFRLGCGTGRTSASSHSQRSSGALL